MSTQYTKEELWKLYEKLPEELKDAVFSQETADNIFNICERNQVNEVSKIAYNVGLVLMGALLPAEFQKTIQKDLNIEESIAKNVATEINRFVFYPVKPELEQLHNMDVTKTEKTAPASSSQETEETRVKTVLKNVQTTSQEGDSYREQIE